MTDPDVSRDIEIDLQRAWEDPDSYPTIKDIPDNPRARWHRQMQAAWDRASDLERVNLAAEYRRVAVLEMAYVRAGGLLHVLARRSSDVLARRSSDVVEPPPSPTGSGYVAPQYGTPSVNHKAEEDRLADRLVAQWRARGGR